VWFFLNQFAMNNKLAISTLFRLINGHSQFWSLRISKDALIDYVIQTARAILNANQFVKSENRGF
jgi:hypothetical protein